MSTTTIIVIVIIAVVLVAIAIVSKHSHHKYVFHEEQVRKAIAEVFDENGPDEMSRAKFQHAFQLKINCSRKEMLFLFGKARSLNMINVDGDLVSRVK